MLMGQTHLRPLISFRNAARFPAEIEGSAMAEGYCVVKSEPIRTDSAE